MRLNVPDDDLALLAIAARLAAPVFRKNGMPDFAARMETAADYLGAAAALVEETRRDPTVTRSAALHAARSRRWRARKRAERKPAEVARSA